MVIKCTCGQPLRFLGSIGTLMGQVVAVECPDENCKKHRVIMADEWFQSLEVIP